MPFLVQILLPRNANQGPHPVSRFAQIRAELTAKFGGITVYTQSVAEGLWKSDQGVVEQDEMVLFEVMTSKLQSRWWRRYRRELEDRFHQVHIVVRAHKIRRF